MHTAQLIPMPDLPPNRKITEGLHPSPRQTIPKPDVDLSSVELIETHIEGLEYVGSYNWVDSPSPTIIVPGKFLA
jgi:hypothetical protein